MSEINLLFFSAFFFLFYHFLGGLHHTACRILVSQPGIEPVPPAVEVWSLNHWTAREVPCFSFFFFFFLLAYGLLNFLNNSIVIYYVFLSVSLCIAFSVVALVITIYLCISIITVYSYGHFTHLSEL